MCRSISAARPRWAALAFCLVLVPGAARAQSPAELVNQGRLYDNGLGVAREGSMAQKLYIAAAKANSISGKNDLAYL
jgi:TPR repeat protein